MAEKNYEVTDEQVRDTNKPGIEHFKYTGHDGNGTEVGVRVGCGVIYHMDIKNGMVKPAFDFRIGKHNDETVRRAEYKELGGWIASNADDVIKFVNEAAENGTPILYRIESVRLKPGKNDSYDDTTPIDDIRPNRRQARLVAVAPIDAGTMREHPENWLHTNEILVDPSEDKGHEYWTSTEASAFGQEHVANVTEPTSSPSGYGRLDLLDDIAMSDTMSSLPMKNRVKYSARITKLLLDEVAPTLQTPDAIRIISIAFDMNELSADDIKGKPQMDAYIIRIRDTAQAIVTALSK